ncbi:MAG: 2-oxoacid:acceptor oxidoreductase family protein [Armatimonadota bacterium]
MGEHSVIIAGAGGQGVLLIGEVLCHAANLEGKACSWYPEYGPEVRGGWASCAVVIGDAEVASPVVGRADALIAMNPSGYRQFIGALQPRGLLVLNSSLVSERPTRGDVDVLAIDANEIAESLGAARAANMVMLGAYVQRSGIVKFETLPRVLEEVLPERHRRFIPVNVEALSIGARHADTTIKAA